MGYDSGVDILDIQLSSVPRITSREIAPGVVADLDKEGNIVALEIVDASDRYSSEDLARFSFERTPA
ncbi:MAG: DUF2283 domain-containing protein [Chloroflexi bacterium]|nr:DUF2283 domain-containing protein [Chloroflexota bacterium]